MSHTQISWVLALDLVLVLDWVHAVLALQPRVVTALVTDDGVEAAGAGAVREGDWNCLHTD